MFYHFRSSYFGRPPLRKESESQSQYEFKTIQLLVADWPLTTLFLQRHLQLAIISAAFECETKLPLLC